METRYREEHLSLRIMREYLTYKEWKQPVTVILALNIIVAVSTLPIRNGNFLLYAFDSRG